MRSSHIPRIPLIALVLAVLALDAGAEPGADASVAAFRAKMARWVEARQVLSAERADWLVEKETLQATQQLLRRERDELRAQIDEFAKSDVGADQERSDLLARREALQGGFATLETEIQELERQVLAIVPGLPEPLQARLEPLIVQIPTDPASGRKVALGQRLMSVLGVLAQAEKWNGTATFVGETRPIGEGGEQLQVRTLYWGLGQAIYVDSHGEIAGLGRPAETGWQFVDDRSLAADAKLLLDIYEGNVDTIAFVPVPVELR
jgi:hypothetical protein